MVYMKNLALGNGFVFNVGGERVEGFTSLLWVIIGSSFYHFTSNPELFLVILNITLISIVLFCITNFIDDKDDNSRLSKKSVFFLLLVGITPGFIDWTVFSLMETGLWCFLLSMTTIQIIRYNKNHNKTKHYLILSFLYTLLVLCRPESMLWVPVFIILNASKEYIILSSPKIFSRGTIISSIIFATTLLIIIIWRLDYFGYPLPNTYYAKVSSNRYDNLISGLNYVYSLFIQKPFILILLIQSTLFILIKAYKNEINSNLTNYTLFSITVITLLVPLYSGGDHFELHRFIMPSIPIMLLSWILILHPKYFHNIITRVSIILIILIIFISNLINLNEIWTEQCYPLKNEWDIALRGRKASHELNTFFKSHNKLPSQGVFVAGGTAYSYNGETIDLLGLNNTKMAHSTAEKDKTLPKNHASFNKDVFYTQNPDIFWHLNCGIFPFNKPIDTLMYIDTNRFISKVYKNIHFDDKFKENYSFCRIESKHLNVLEIFASNRFIESLDSNMYKIYILNHCCPSKNIKNKGA
jgi:arabinofuranosyltransferase